MGILGAPDDPHTRALASALGHLGALPVVLDPLALDRGTPASFDGESYRLGDTDLGDLRGLFVRSLGAVAPPAFHVGDRFVLMEDWFVVTMQRRERAQFIHGMLATLHARGIPVVNPPQHGLHAQLKGFQLWAARAAGLAIPRTLTTNSPAQARAFLQQTPDAITKPSTGGGLCTAVTPADLRRLDRIVEGPVTFQQRITGEPLRLTVLGDTILSAVRVLGGDGLDWRAEGAPRGYRPVTLPPSLPRRIRRLMRECGLVFAGVDLLQPPQGDPVFLEANPCPAWLDIERRTGSPLTDMLANHLVRLAHHPARLARRLAQAATARSFSRYALPWDPTRTAGG